MKPKRHKLYHVWAQEKTRCNNKNDKRYSSYGGRGIRMSLEFSDFKQWVKYVESLANAYKNNYTIDRIDNNGNYERGNLRWVNKSTQVRNTRRIRTNNTSGYRGVYYSKQIKRWVARITINSKMKHLGTFDYAWTGAYAYDSYVINNKLEHTINFETDIQQCKTILKELEHGDR